MGADIHIKIDGGVASDSVKKDSAPKSNENETALPNFSEAPVSPPPDWVQKAIADHQSGKGKVPIFVDPKMAKDLEAWYGPHGLVSSHNPDEHGPLGHQMTEEPQLPQ